jgi:hypothetical protein
MGVNARRLREFQRLTPTLALPRRRGRDVTCDTVGGSTEAMLQIPDTARASAPRGQA